MDIRINLTGDLKKKYEFLKKEKGNLDNANTIRVIIADHYRLVTKGGRKES